MSRSDKILSREEKLQARKQVKEANKKNWQTKTPSINHRDPERNEEKVVIFMHIPKTGGTTLRSIIRKQYKAQEAWRSEEWVIKFPQLSTQDHAGLKCLFGEIFFGIHRFITAPYTYITLLRDPIEQVISSYYFILRRPDMNDHHIVKNMSFKEFITMEQFKGKTSNRQTRFISGGDRCDLNQAKSNLNKYFTLAGITEMYNESLFLMKKEFGWADISYEIRNVTKDRPTKDELPSDIIDILKKNNQLDLELYEFAQERLIKKIQSLDHKAKEQLQKYINSQKK